MDLKTQEKISSLMVVQAEKLGEALKALRIIAKMNPNSAETKEAILIANIALKKVSEYGKDTKDL